MEPKVGKRYEYIWRVSVIRKCKRCGGAETVILARASKNSQNFSHATPRPARAIIIETRIEKKRCGLLLKASFFPPFQFSVKSSWKTFFRHRFKIKYPFGGLSGTGLTWYYGTIRLIGRIISSLASAAYTMWCNSSCLNFFWYPVQNFRSYLWLRINEMVF